MLTNKQLDILRELTLKELNFINSNSNTIKEYLSEYKKEIHCIYQEICNMYDIEN